MANKNIFKFNDKVLEFIPINEERGENQTQKKKPARSPGSGIIEISPPNLSAESVSSGETVRCKSSVTGKNIAQLFSDVMLQVGDKMYGPITRDFLHSPTDREVRGVIHPRWAAENEVEFIYTPQVRLLFCGEGYTLACMNPESYGVKPEDQIWCLEGIYQRGGGEPFRVKLEFSQEGALIRKTGFYPISADGVVSPFELLIEDGDTFEPFASVLTKDGTEGLVTLNPIMLGGGSFLHWELADAPAGVYHVGVVAEDFDGMLVEKLSPLTVK